MFRNLITIPVRINMYNRRIFSSSCNNYKIDEVTNKLERQERYLKIIDEKIGILTVMSFFNIMFSMIF
jgi:hypothetical protein